MYKRVPFSILSLTSRKNKCSNDEVAEKRLKDALRQFNFRHSCFSHREVNDKDDVKKFLEKIFKSIDELEGVLHARFNHRRFSAKREQSYPYLYEMFKDLRSFCMSRIKDGDNSIEAGREAEKELREMDIPISLEELDKTLDEKVFEFIALMNSMPSIGKNEYVVMSAKRGCLARNPSIEEPKDEENIQLGLFKFFKQLNVSNEEIKYFHDQLRMRDYTKWVQWGHHLEKKDDTRYDFYRNKIIPLSMRLHVLNQDLPSDFDKKSDISQKIIFLNNKIYEFIENISDEEKQNRKSRLFAIPDEVLWEASSHFLDEKNNNPHQLVSWEEFITWAEDFNGLIVDAQTSQKKQFELGVKYINGDKITQNVKKGVEWVKRAAAFRDEAWAEDWGHCDAQIFLGKTYKVGKIVDEDRNESKKYFELAANWNCSLDALIELEKLANIKLNTRAIYRYRLGTYYKQCQEFKKAMEWYEKAAKIGSTEAFLGMSGVAKKDGALPDNVGELEKKLANLKQIITGFGFEYDDLNQKTTPQKTTKELKDEITFICEEVHKYRSYVQHLKSLRALKK